jgi:hypothetical protein
MTAQHARLREGMPRLLSIALALYLGGALLAGAEPLGAQSLPELMDKANAAMASGNLAEIAPLLVESERDMLAAYMFIVTVRATPEFFADGTTIQDRIRMSEESPDLGALRTILERRGFGHLFGTAATPWDGPVLESTDPSLVMERLHESFGQDPIGLIADLQPYLGRIRDASGHSPLEQLDALMPQGPLGDVRVTAGQVSIQTPDSTVYVVREEERLFLKFWKIELKASAPGKTRR